MLCMLSAPCVVSIFLISAILVSLVHVWLCLYFIKSKWCLTSFHVVICHSYIFCEMSMYFACFLVGLLVFFSVQFWEFFIYARQRSLVWYMICKYYIMISSLFFFILLAVFFTEQKFLILMKSKLSDFNFMDYTFGDMSNTYLDNPRSWIFTPVFSALYFISVSVVLNQGQFCVAHKILIYIYDRF